MGDEVTKSTPRVHLLAYPEISRKQSSQWQQVAAIDRDTRAQYIGTCIEKDKEITTAGLLTFARPASLPDAPEFPDGTFPTIVADPPWQYDADGPKGAAAHYPVMPADEIADLTIHGRPVQDLAPDDGHFYLWTTNAHMVEAHRVMRAWGYEPKTILTWVKKPGFGLGAYFRNTTEHVLFGVRGHLPPARHDVPTHFEAPMARHSEKPDVLFEIAASVSPGPRLELFAREKREGWACWGNEVADGLDEVEGMG